MRKFITLFMTFLFPVLSFSQNNEWSDHFKTSNDTINKYYKKVDFLSSCFYNQVALEKLKYSYKVIDNISAYKNVLTTDYWDDDIKVNFVFKDDNLSYLTPRKFDEFRREFYKNQIFNILVYINENQNRNNFYRVRFENKSLTYFKTENFISTVIYYKNVKRFLRIEYYLFNNELIKIKIQETNSEFQWDKINNTELYYKNDKIVFQKFYQFLMDGRFGLETKFTNKELINKSKKLGEKVIN